MTDLINHNILMDFFKDSNDFEFLFKKNNHYYLNSLNRLNSNLINNLAKSLVAYYHREYYIALDKIIEKNDLDWDEYDFYNQNLLDDYLDKVECEIQVFTEKDLRILVAILDISFLFLKNATEESDFESALTAFFQLKDKLESNSFTKKDYLDVVVGRDYDNFSENNIGDGWEVHYEY